MRLPAGRFRRDLRTAIRRSTRSFWRLRNFSAAAASEKLRLQAETHLAAAETTADYTEYARSVFAAEQALELYPPSEAKRVLSDARDSYATAALQKQDFDLGLTILAATADRPLAAGEADEANLPARYRGTYRKLLAGKTARQKVRRLNQVLKTVAALLLVGMLGMGAFAGIQWRKADVALSDLKTANGDLKDVTEKKREVELAKAKAEQDAKDAVVAMENAEEAKKRVEQEKQLVVAEKAAAEAATKDAVAAKSRAEADKKTAEAEKARVESEKLVVETQKKQAEEEKAAALAATKLAIAQKKVVEDQKAIVEGERAAAERAAVAAKQQQAAVNYQSLISLADQQVSQNLFDDARETFKELEAAVNDKVFPQPKNDAYIRLQQALNLDLARTEGRSGVPLIAVSANPDGQGFATVDASGVLKLWSAEKFDPSRPALKPVRELPTGRKVECLSFSPDGNRLVAGGSDGTLWIGTAAEFDKAVTLARDESGKAGHSDRIARVAFLSNDLLVSASADKTLRVWNVNNKNSISSIAARRCCWFWSQRRSAFCRSGSQAESLRRLVDCQW